MKTKRPSESVPVETPVPTPASSVRQAIDRIPRKPFLADEVAGLAYSGHHLPVPEGQTVLPPAVLATLIEALDPNPDLKVLEIGTGVGYAAAVLSGLVKEVCATERSEPLLETAQRHLAGLGCRNVKFRQAEPSDGWPEEGPFGAILVSSRGNIPTKVLRLQLAMGGRLVTVAGTRRPRQALLRITRTGENSWQEEKLGEIQLVRRLGDLLVELGAVGEEAVEKAAGDAAAARRPIGQQLRDGAKLEEADLVRALAAQRGFKYGTLDTLINQVDLEVVQAFPKTFLEHNVIVPISRTGTLLTVATPSPDCPVDALRNALPGTVLEVVLVSATDFRRLWSSINLIRAGREVSSTIRSAGAGPGAGDLVLRDESFAEAHFVKLFESMLLDAIAERASDIHLERYGERVRVRIRVDGDMRDLPRYRLTPAEHQGVINVIKIRTELDIAERRLPQGGRSRVKAGGRTFDLRVQIQPALHGEHAVIRILPQDVKVLTIEDLGFTPEIASEYRRLLDQPSGLILVVGPTGSGKSTTLYAGLQILAQDSTRKVITAEDPIEYAIENIQQSQVVPEIGFAFASAMRSFVRQDPDVILVGEIRDGETALEAIRASQTGHLVFSTLHCNDSTDALQRLFDLGMHPNSIASELLAVMAQRLAKRICPACRVKAVPDPELLARIYPKGVPADFTCYRGAGCSACGGYGTRGRVACIEFLRTNIPIRSAISQHPPVEEFRQLALANGLMTMRDTALKLVNSGLIALTELPFMIQSERLAPER